VLEKFTVWALRQQPELGRSGGSIYLLTGWYIDPPSRTVTRYNIGKYGGENEV